MLEKTFIKGVYINLVMRVAIVFGFLEISYTSVQKHAGAREKVLLWIGLTHSIMDSARIYDIIESPADGQ